MKGLFGVLLVLCGMALLSPERAQAQCGKCIVDTEIPYTAHCQHGPLNPPAQKDCEDRPDNQCWEDSQSCYDDFSLNELELQLTGAPKIVASLVGMFANTSVFKTCGGAIVAFSYRPSEEIAMRAATDHLIV